MSLPITPPPATGEPTTSVMIPGHDDSLIRHDGWETVSGGDDEYGFRYPAPDVICRACPPDLGPVPMVVVSVRMVGGIASAVWDTVCPICGLRWSYAATDYRTDHDRLIGGEL